MTIAYKQKMWGVVKTHARAHARMDDGNPPHTAWDPLWRFLWDGRRHMNEQVQQLQADLDVHDQALVAYAMLRFHGLPCPAPLRSNLKSLASQGMQRWAHSIGQGRARTPAARWLFRATRGAPMPYVERKVQQLLRRRQAATMRAGGKTETNAAFTVQYRKEGTEIKSEIVPANDHGKKQVQQARATHTPSGAQGEDAAPPSPEGEEEEEEEEQNTTTEVEYASKDDTCDHKCLPPLPPVFSMYAQSIQTTD